MVTVDFEFIQLLEFGHYIYISVHFRLNINLLFSQLRQTTEVSYFIYLN